MNERTIYSRPKGIKRFWGFPEYQDLQVGDRVRWRTGAGSVVRRQTNGEWIDVRQDTIIALCQGPQQLRLL